MNQLKIIKAQVLTGNGSDKVTLFTDLPDACYPFSGQLALNFMATSGMGSHYCREHFGIDPEVVSLQK